MGEPVKPVPKPPSTTTASFPPISLLLFLVIPLAVFWQCLTLPFIQDDWSLIELFQTRGTATLISRFFDFRGKLFYRPAAHTYLWLLYKAFGMQAWPVHALALLIHALSSFLVCRIVTRLSDDRTIGLASAVIYASAVSIHLDPLSWAVGIYDLGGALFFFTAMWLFISGRTFSSALSYLIGSLFKEAVVVLPPILFCLELARQPGPLMKKAQSVALRLLPHCAILALILGLRISSGQSLTALPPSHPYVFAFAGRHVPRNALKYVTWMLQSFVPLGRVHISLSHFILGGVVLCAVVIAVLRRGRYGGLLLALSFWMVLALFPVLFLPNHAYRYYATYALPAFICTGLLLARETLTLVGVRERTEKVIACGAGLIVLTAVLQSDRMFGQGLHCWTLADGTNGLIRKASYVRLVQPFLLRYLPSPANGATILLSGVDLWSFNKDSGPHVWYGNTTLRVYDLKDLRRDSGRFFIEGRIQSHATTATGAKAQRVYIDPANLHAFELSDTSLYTIALADLERIAEEQTRR